MKVLQSIGMFIMGIRDAISIQWLRQILLYLDPQTKKVHPKSKQLLDCLKSSLGRILLYIIVVPLFFEYLLTSFSLLFRVFYLILTYGYLFFSNTDVMTSTRKVIIWKQKRIPNSNFELDKNERIELFTKLSGKIKSFIFLLFYYLPIFLLEITVLLKIPYLGRTLLIISQSYFNGVFYFLQNWNYDVFNVGYLEKNFCYMLGFGFIVSVICNLFLSGIYSTAAYLIISIWMLINTIVYSPPQIQFNSIEDILNIFRNYRLRKTYRNDYNRHREKIRQNKEYRKQLINEIFLLYPALKITEILNTKISILFKQNNQKSEFNQDNQEEKTQKISQISQMALKQNSQTPIIELDQMDSPPNHEVTNKIH